MTMKLLTVATHDATLYEWQQERRLMDEQELVALLKSHGWMYKRRIRRKGKLYIYARRRSGARMEERYLAPLRNLDQLTHEQIINKLQLGDEPNVAAATECHTFRAKIAIHSVA